MAKKKSAKKKATKRKSSKRKTAKVSGGQTDKTVEIHLPADLHALAMKLKAEDAQALEAVLHSVVGDGAKFDVDEVIIKPKTDATALNSLAKSC